MKKKIMFCLVLFLLLSESVYSDSLSDKYEEIMRKNNNEVEKEIAQKKSFPPFSWEVLKNKLSKRNFTNDQKLQIFHEYYLETTSNITTINSNEIIIESIPYEIKKELLTSSKINYEDNVVLDNYTKLRDFFIRNNCPECIEKSYLIKNKNIFVSSIVKNIYKYQLFDTYYFTPEGGSKDLFLFLDNKKDGIKFGIGDTVESRCNTSFDKDDKIFVFWHCRIKSINNEPSETNYKSRSVKYKIKKNCGSIKMVKKKLQYKSLYTGKINGNFAPKLFFSLLKFNGTGDLDESTCTKLKNIALPESDALSLLPIQKKTIVESIENNSELRNKNVKIFGLHGYSIQLLATKSKRKANKLKKQMRSEGYFSFIEKIKNENVWRVRLGFYPDEINGERNIEKLKNRYKKNISVIDSTLVRLKSPLDIKLISKKNISGIESMVSLGNLLRVNTNKDFYLYKTNNSKYSIQVFATSNNKLAEQAAILFRNFNYNSYVMEGSSSGEAIFRLRIGSKNRKKNIYSLLKKLKSEFSNSKTLKKSIIYTNKNV